MIWYACYGSNMDLNRFLKYIQGGELIVNGRIRRYAPCPSDIAEPRQTEPYFIKRRLYFAKKSNTWNKQGVGFISTKSNPRSLTYSKLYLISEDQFAHLFAGENSVPSLSIDYNRLGKTGILDFDSDYHNRIIQLDKNYKGYPILTFTNKKNLPDNKPMRDYLELIGNGIKETHNISTEQLADYFIKSNAGFGKKTLWEIFNSESPGSK